MRYAIFLTIMFIKGVIVIIAFPCTTILLTNSASSLRILGTLNGFATTFSGLGRAAGPALIGAVFSWGAKIGYAIAPWWFLGLIAAVGAIPPWFIVEGEGPTRSLGSGGADTEEDSLIPPVDDDDEVAILDALDDLDSSGSDDGSAKALKKTSAKRSYGTIKENGNGMSK
jgi:MFS family permease